MTCPNGHTSTETDYCSVCGVKMDGAGSPTVEAPAPATSISAGGVPCPNCATEMATDSRFCEVCGYDVADGSVIEAPVVKPLDAPVETPPPAEVVEPTTDWIAVVTADRTYYDRNDVTDVQYPLGMPARSIVLTPGAAHAIGRRSRSRGTNPEIDLAGPPEDPGVSHTHASLLPRDDGGWDLVDHGSTNGTFLNESPDPVAVNTPIALEPGDRVYIGAWTRVELVLRPGPSA